VTSTLASRKRESIPVLVLVAILALLLPLLAALQYRWQGQLSEAGAVQMREMLQSAVNRISAEFDAEMSALYGGFQTELGRTPGRAEGFDAARSYARWAQNARYPHVIKEVWLAGAGADSGLALQRLNPESLQFEATPWPAELAVLHRQMENQMRSMRSWSDPPGPDRRQPGGPQLSPVSDRPFALLSPIFDKPDLARPMDFRPHPPEGFLILALRLDVITSEMLPELVKRNFPADSGADIYISVVRRNEPDTVIFEAGPPVETAGASRRMADVTAGMLRVRFGGFPQASRGRGAGSPDSGAIPPPKPEANAGGRGRSGEEERRPGFGPKQGPDQGWNREDGHWEIRARHREGSLEAAVSKIRRRNLAISFGVLILLGGSIIAIVISTRRARTLAEQQIEFVATVTHELRTPISVIHTAGQNLADGIIRGETQTRQYGELISRESRRLAGMIEQVLEFACGQARREGLALRNLNVAGWIEGALVASQPLAKEGGFRIESAIEPGLPDILGDEPSLRRALQNLLDNAMKFSGSSRWLGVTAKMNKDRKRREIQVSVQDRGLGIPQDECGRVFDPFFRGREASSAQIHGSGLGLSLVKSILDAHGGRISLESSPGRGSKFSIFLPVAMPNPADTGPEGAAPEGT
jgi:two-component system, OmpR family, sensor histidine kinase SenX3